VVAVEGYVDVIAMVQAGHEAAVAPLGTALTEDQLALLWKMADEPILCFDGDSAGHRAAYRAVDLALPLVKPGKSLRFASLPEGQDPDDLWRSGGRAAIDDVLGAARPLAQVLWMRETEAGGFDTPERRAALEARVREVTATITDETVRKYYRSDLGDRLRRLFEPQEQFARAPARPARTAVSRQPRPGAGRDRGYRPRPGTGGAAAPTVGVGGGPYVVLSPQLAASPIHRGHRAAIARREALIMQAVINHPWLLDEHLETLAGIEFRHSDAEKVKAALVDIGAQWDRDGAPDCETMRTELGRRGLADLIARIDRSITTPAVWGARPDAAPADVLMTWTQLIALHRQWHSLIKELKDAEQALGQDPTEANYSWLQDVKARLSVIEGTEALVEGFGASSGRAAQSF